MALLSLRNVTRRFGGIVALDGVSLDVPEGQIVGLIGPNGAGKTTAFNVITRLYTPNEGDVLFDGETLLKTPVHGIVRRGIARTFQNVERDPVEGDDPAESASHVPQREQGHRPEELIRAGRRSAKRPATDQDGRYSPRVTEIAAELHMSRGQKITNLLGVTIPFAGFLASIFFLWGQYVTWRDLVIFAVGYALTTLGISIGFHRLFTHRSYETFKSIRYGLAVLGSMAVQGPVIRWVSDHRKHHSFADREGDPHSPHAGFGPGVRGKIAGLWHAHVGWLFRNVGRAEWTKYAKDLLADRGMVFISRWFGLWVALSLLLPFLAGYLWGGTVGAGLQALFWGGVIRIFLLHHITWSVNSVCHFVGSRRFRVKDESRNVWWLSWISFGESWHHNHHAFPSSAFHGLRPWELDIGGLVIRLLRRLGLVWKVNTIPVELQRRRELAAE